MPVFAPVMRATRPARGKHGLWDAESWAEVVEAFVKVSVAGAEKFSEQDGSGRARSLLENVRVWIDRARARCARLD